MPTFIKPSQFYTLRNESGCSFLVKIEGITNPFPQDATVIQMPPFLGYILSNIGKYEYTEACEKIGAALNVGASAVGKFIDQLKEADGHKKFNISEKAFIIFPENLLQISDTPDCNEYFTDKNFDPLAAFTPKRPVIPFNINLMITGKCTTDCIYCYANRKLGNDLDTDEILRIVKELRSTGVVNLSITGGDVFARKDWKEILKYVREVGYKPFLSTKTPLNEEELHTLKELKYDSLQFSLDSINGNTLADMVKAKNGYLTDLKKMLDICDRLDIKIQIRSVLTSLNGKIEEIEKLYSFLSSHQCIAEWDITPAFFSEFKQKEYNAYEISNDSLTKIYEFTHKPELKLKISLNKMQADGYKLKRYPETSEFVAHNQICMGNSYCLSILSTGECNICEMLYQNPEYLVGDITKQSLKEIWNSEKALNLYCPKQDEITNDSPCKECNDFESCKATFGKRICYVNILKTGGCKFDPDPGCPKAKSVDLIL